MRSVYLLCFACTLLIFSRVEAIGKYQGLEFIEACSKRDPNLEECLARSANTLAEHFREGELQFFKF